LHLGADRVLIVGSGRQSIDQPRARSNVYPSLAQIAGHALNSLFLDSLMVDIEGLERINRTLALIPPEALKDSQLRPVKVLFITPSQPLERIAARFVHELPPTVRFILRPTGALNRSGSNLASYLLFEEPFCRALIELGYDDTMRRAGEVRQFFDYSERRVHCCPAAAAGSVRALSPALGAARRADPRHGHANARSSGDREAHRRPPLDRALPQHDPQHGEVLHPGPGAAARDAPGDARRGQPAEKVTQAFAFAHGPDWRACVDALGRPGRGLGFVYFTDALAGEADKILDSLKTQTGVRDW